MLRNQIEELQREVEHNRKNASQDRDLIDNLLTDQNGIRNNFLKVVKVRAGLAAGFPLGLGE